MYFLSNCDLGKLTKSYLFFRVLIVLLSEETGYICCI